VQPFDQLFKRNKKAAPPGNFFQVAARPSLKSPSGTFAPEPYYVTTSKNIIIGYEKHVKIFPHKIIYRSQSRFNIKDIEHLQGEGPKLHFKS
jgi:hypothetical protein